MTPSESKADTSTMHDPDAPARPVPIALNVRLVALAVREPDGRYSVSVPALQGCYSEADTIEDVEAQATEAAEAWLEAMHDTRRDEVLRDMSTPRLTEAEGRG